MSQLETECFILQKYQIAGTDELSTEAAKNHLNFLMLWCNETSGNLGKRSSVINYSLILRDSMEERVHVQLLA